MQRIINAVNVLLAVIIILTLLSGCGSVGRYNVSPGSLSVNYFMTAPAAERQMKVFSESPSIVKVLS
jgi:uncharacterized protein YceK